MECRHELSKDEEIVVVLSMQQEATFSLLLIENVTPKGRTGTLAHEDKLRLVWSLKQVHTPHTTPSLHRWGMIQ